MNIDITALYVVLDDFAQAYEVSEKQQQIEGSGSKKKRRNRSGKLSLGEMLLIEVLYHFGYFKDFKRFYKYGVCGELREYFGELPSYERYVILKKRLFMPITILLHSVMGEKTGLYFADSTPIKVCHNKRINRNKVFKDYAERGKSTMGWFYGLKLHTVFNQKGEIVAVRITAGNVDDRKALRAMARNLKGKLYADKGYIGKQLFANLWEKGLHLITGIRKNMKNYLMPYIDKILLRKRYLVETSYGVMKQDMNLEHTKHRNPINALVSILACLVAYQFKPAKPKIKTNLVSA